MRAKLIISLCSAVLVLLLGLWLAHPPVIRANGDKDEEKGGHAHVPAPLEYADTHVPLNVWTDQAMIARGKAIYTTRCAVCHGAAGDGKGPGGVALPLKPPDFRDQDGVAEMRDNYWFWRVSEGGQVEPFKGKGSAMPPWKGELSVDDRWAVMAYQHTFSEHHGPHVPWEHPGSVAMGRDIFAMACVPCHGVAGKGDGSVGPMLAPRRAPQPRDFTSAEFKFRSTPSGQLPTTADLFRTLTEGVRSSGGPMTIGLRGDRRDGYDPAGALQERRAARGRVSDARDGARRHADAIVRRLARARPAMGPRVLRAVAVSWRTHGGGGIPLSA